MIIFAENFFSIRIFKTNENECMTVEEAAVVHVLFVFKVRIIDKGIDIEVERNTLFPSNSRAKIVTNCVCPILVVGADEEQKQVAAQISGRECRCVNGLISFM